MDGKGSWHPLRLWDQKCYWSAKGGGRLPPLLGQCCLERSGPGQRLLGTVKRQPVKSSASGHYDRWFDPMRRQGASSFACPLLIYPCVLRSWAAPGPLEPCLPKAKADRRMLVARLQHAVSPSCLPPIAAAARALSSLAMPGEWRKLSKHCPAPRLRLL